MYPDARYVWRNTTGGRTRTLKSGVRMERGFMSAEIGRVYVIFVVCSLFPENTHSILAFGTLSPTPASFGTKGNLRMVTPFNRPGSIRSLGQKQTPESVSRNIDMFAKKEFGSSDTQNAQRCIEVRRQYPGLRQVHKDPDIYTIDNFFDKKTCEGFMTVGPRGEKDGSAKKVESKIFQGRFDLLKSAATLALGQTITKIAQARKSTTWFLKYGSAAPLIRRALSIFPGVDLQNCEEPQVVRYDPGDFFDWHQDALPSEQAGKAGNGGQRVATILVYLNDVRASEGGATQFRDLGLTVQPQQGKALLFFPAFADGTADSRTIHAGKPVTAGTKWIAQLWIHQGKYMPSVPPGNTHADFYSDPWR